jgi:hypothetical protein
MAFARIVRLCCRCVYRPSPSPRIPDCDQVYSRCGASDAIVTAGYIFTRYTNGEEMLYDLGNDPQENRNVSGSPAFERRRLQLSNRLDAELARAQSASVPAPVRKTRKRNEGDDPSERR